MLRSQEEFYLQGQYCNQCVDLDIFLLQVILYTIYIVYSNHVKKPCYIVPTDIQGSMDKTGLVLVKTNIL